MVDVEDEQTSKLHESVAFEVDTVASKGSVIWVSHCCVVHANEDFAGRVDKRHVEALSSSLVNKVDVAKVLKVDGTDIKFES